MKIRIIPLIKTLVNFEYNIQKIKGIFMELKLARVELDAKPKKTDISKIEAMLNKKGSLILYFDRENSHKDLLELQDHFEEMGKSFYMKEVKYGLADNEYMYQIHIIN